ncbi:hypothetical protein FE257_007743 [Aspergillus nanangensis]|uniref:Uncharacterized protein n=1 Tax=Aspergillus nanangensis TaxID=2582783 RepID=A0AAD4CWX1_ASPNN|nr:hypothetical protein FE257_007743 [Aspergillus nanangensis]
MLHRSFPGSAAYSLEAFIGDVDFVQFQPQLSVGGMLGSPSSTAAYLIHSSDWDGAAEAYLHRVLSCGSGRGAGSAPGTYPTTVFELAWVSANIQSYCSEFTEETGRMLQQIGTTLKELLVVQDGLVGGAQGMCVDADETAKTVFTLNWMGIPTSPDSLIDRFESSEYFLSYGHERNPSISTNAHVLLALLYAPETTRYTSQNAKCARYLCRVWWESDDLVHDKWNI